MLASISISRLCGCTVALGGYLKRCGRDEEPPNLLVVARPPSRNVPSSDFVGGITIGCFEFGPHVGSFTITLSIRHLCIVLVPTSKLCSVELDG